MEQKKIVRLYKNVCVCVICCWVKIRIPFFICLKINKQTTRLILLLPLQRVCTVRLRVLVNGAGEEISYFDLPACLPACLDLCENRDVSDQHRSFVFFCLLASPTKQKQIEQKIDNLSLFLLFNRQRITR